jgi:alpha-D-xyloside xylohydrolase
MRPTFVPWVLAVFASAGACSSTHKSAPESATLFDGAAGVVLHGDTRSLVFGRGATTLLTFPADGLSLGVVTALDDGTDYDPYPDGTPPSSPDGLRWLTLQNAHVAAEDAASFTLDLTYDEGKHAALKVENPAPGRFALTLTPAAEGPPVALFKLRARATTTEGFYGLGEYLDDVNQRGHVRAMQLEADGGRTESGYNEAHVPVPFVIGTQGWGLFVATRYPGLFDVAAKEPDLVEATFGTGAASASGLVFHLFSADKPLDVTKHFYDVTGAPRLPARWALGPWLWRDENRDQAQIESDAKTMRDLDLPHTAMWIDRPYATDVETFDFDPKKFTDAPAMLATVQGLGFRMALWHAPYLDAKVATTAALRAQADAGHFYPPTASLPLNKWGTPIDFTSPAAYAWWQKLVHRYTDLGFEGFKLDYAEDIAPTVGTGRNVWRFADGSDERTMQSVYRVLYHQLYAETLPKDGGFLLCRAGTWGEGKNGCIVWPGDLDATFAKNGDQADGYVSVGGLPASVIAGLSLGPSGFPFFGADTGGYRHSPPDKELFMRWFEQTALSTVMQMGNAGNTVAWEPDPQTGFDQEVVDAYRVYTRLHLRLFPYEWTYATQLAATGRPITRALGLAYPALGVHPSDEYLFGDDLLVAPVVARGQRARSVVFPPGEWLDWWTGAVHQGGVTETVDAPLGTLPLFLRRGGVVPLLRPTIDTMSPTTSPDAVDSYATSPGVLYPRVGAGADGSFALFDGGLVETRASGRDQWLHVKGGAELGAGALVEVLGLAGAPSAATIDGAASPVLTSRAALDAAAEGVAFEAGSAFVKLAGGEHTAVLTH